MGLKGCPETSVTTNERCVTSQKSENLSQTSPCVLVNRATAHVRTANTIRVYEIRHWLQVSVQSQGPAAGKLDQGIPRFPSVLEQMLSRYPKSTLHCMLIMQPRPKLTSKFFSPKCSPPPSPNSIKISSWRCPPDTELSPNVQLLSSSAYS